MFNQFSRRFKRALCLGASVLALAISPALMAKSVEDTLKERISKRIDLPVSEVIKTPFDDLYEVRVQGNIIYTNSGAEFVIFSGQLYDLAAQVNLTEASMEEINRVDIDSLPLDLALKATYGDGSKRLVTFEDPNCVWCKRLQAEFRKMDVTVYTFVTPILTPDSFVKARNIQCADEPVKAWQRWMGDNVAPSEQKDCDPPFNEILALMQKHNVSGTPAIMFDNGKRISGFAPAEQMLERMNEPAAQ